MGFSVFPSVCCGGGGRANEIKPQSHYNHGYSENVGRKSHVDDYSTWDIVKATQVAKCVRRPQGGTVSTSASGWPRDYLCFRAANEYLAQGCEVSASASGWPRDYLCFRAANEYLASGQHSEHLCFRPIHLSCTLSSSASGLRIEFLCFRATRLHIELLCFRATHWISLLQSYTLSCSAPELHVGLLCFSATHWHLCGCALSSSASELRIEPLCFRLRIEFLCYRATH
ncbi:hypothetical protein JZ751_016049 [Albula glossodonta]|uniref:Uncharacterized protein n=1 Tax=Albula glossodonta TaxID=121402 RepID=A0A8T2NYX3_9TELE|nr:hypothetical protein JZ751_016049 [Albula glossodonta]